MEAYRSGGEPGSSEKALARVALTEIAIARSGLLVAWGNAWLSGTVAFDDVLTHVQGSDQPHLVEGMPEHDRVPLGWAVSDLRSRTGSRPVLTLALPAPGDLGMAGPPGLLSAALAAGAAALCPGLALIPGLSEQPQRQPRGTAPVSHQLCWRAVAWPPTGAGSGPAHAVTASDLGAADHDLATALAEAVDRLDRLDLSAARRPDGFGTDASAHRLPPGHSPRALRLLGRADALAAALNTIDAQSHTAVHSGSQQEILAESLGPLAAAVRRARQAAYGWAAPADSVRKGG